jgi:hypothetical protein
MRSLFAGLAALWFGYNASTFLPEMAVYLNEGAPGGIDGDPGAIAITYATRTLFAGLTLVSLALIDWGWLASRLRDSGK